MKAKQGQDMKNKITLLLLLFSCFCVQAQEQTEKQVALQAIHPRSREWATPANGQVVSTNPPALLWPVKSKADSYRVRLSQDKAFAEGQTLESDLLNRGEYTTHTRLNNGEWFWQYATIQSDKTMEWSSVHHFTINANSRIFETPTVETFLRQVETHAHPRLYVNREELSAFRKRNATNPEALSLIGKARKNLGMPLIPEAPTRPRDTTGRTEFEKKVMMRFMYHQFGDKVRKPVLNFCLAYLLTGDEEFIRAAIPHTLHIASMNPDGWATQEDFNRASIMLALAEAYDTGYDFFTPEQRQQILEAVKVRGNYFFRHYAKEFEAQSMDNHVWQHTLRRWMFASIAVLGDLPEATEWLAYCYETWCCRFPILGNDDGGWHDGSSYFQVNFETFAYVPFMLKRITGVNFFDIPWFHRLPSFLAYSFPKDSYSTGFGDGYEKMDKPTKGYVSFADALARELPSPLARWYCDQLINGDTARLYDNTDFTLYRLLTGHKYGDTEPEPPAADTQSLLFRDAGFALMHTDVANTENNLMAVFMSLPFGATGHAHAAHNGFTLNLGGKQMFGGSGHYSNFNDAHTLKHYRTRGHNTVIADGLSPVIGENGYGWIARFANTEKLSYALGDATHAFGEMTSPFWLNRMQLSDVEYSRENGFGNPEVTRYRRHFILLRPDIVVVYDELAARQPIRWTWLLHSYNPLRLKGGHSLFASNEAGESRFDLFAAGKINAAVGNDFFSPAENWKSRTGSNGKPLEYEKHWHAEFETSEKSDATRFLGIFQIKTGKGVPAFITPEMKNGKVKIGEWTIEAELNAQKTASLLITDREGNAILYNKNHNHIGAKIPGSTVIVEAGKVLEELTDITPGDRNTASG